MCKKFCILLLLKPCKLIMDRLMKPQFTVDDVYISPFKGRRVFDTNTGKVSYVPTDRNLNPTGVKVFDAYMRYIGSDNIFSLMSFTEQNGVSRPDFAGLCRILTGMTSTDLFHEILFRLADDLLRYTSMPVSEVARRCGANTQQNLCLLFRKRYNCTPTERRRSLQRKGEADMYCV